MHMDEIPFGKALANNRSKAVLQRELGHVVDLDRAGIPRSSARTTDAGWANDSSLDGTGLIRSQDDLVNIPANSLVRQRRDLFDVSDVVILFVWVWRLAIALILSVSLLETLTKTCQVQGRCKQRYPCQQASTADVDVNSRLLGGVTSPNALRNGLGRGHIVGRLSSICKSRQWEVGRWQSEPRRY